MPPRRLARSFFRAIFFGPRGNICGSCEAVDRRRDSAPCTRQVLTFRGSPSPANYACLFLPLPLFSLLLRLPPLRVAVVLFSPFILPPRFFSHLLSLPSSCTLPFLSFSPTASFPIAQLRSPSACCPRANFLHSFERFSTLYFSFSIIELQKLLNILHVFQCFSMKLYFRQYLIITVHYEIMAPPLFTCLSLQCFLSIFRS